MADTTQMQGLIDDFLTTTSGRSLISSDEVADLLLDLRNALDEIKFENTEIPEPVGVTSS